MHLKIYRKLFIGICHFSCVSPIFISANLDSIYLCIRSLYKTDHLHSVLTTLLHFIIIYFNRQEVYKTCWTTFFLMSAEASSKNVVLEPSCSPSTSSHATKEKHVTGLINSKYVKLNVGGSLHYTTVQTLSKEAGLLRNMCDGSTEMTFDSEGRILSGSVRRTSRYYLPNNSKSF